MTPPFSALGSIVKSGHTLPHLALAAAIVLAAAFSARSSLFPSANANIAVVAFAFFALWMFYSAAVAKLASGDFFASFQKALVLDSLSYVPMLLPLLVKLALTASSFGPEKYAQFGNLPVAVAFGAAVAANTAVKVVFFPKNFDLKPEGPLFTRRIRIAVAAAILIYALFFSVVSVMKHSSFNSTAFDLAIFGQTMWGYSHGYGPGFFNTVRGLVLLGDHMQPILFAYSLLYKFLPMPESLLVLQSLALALGALPIYLLARKRIGPAAAAMLAASYLFYPSLQYINLFDFHPEAFATPLFLFALYFADARKYWAAALTLAIAGLSKEHFPLAFVSVGAYISFWQKKKVLGAAFAAAGLAWLLVNFKVLLPQFYSGGGYLYASWFSYLGSSVPEIAKNAFLHPQLVLWHLFSPDKLIYVALLLFPLGLAVVALLGLPELLIAAPFLAINVLRGSDVTAAILYHRNAELIPFLYFAAIAGAQRLSSLLSLLKLSNKKIAAASLVLVAAVAASAAYGPFATIYDLKDFTWNEHIKTGRSLLSEIPQSASVSADPYLLPHLSHRKEAFMFPNPFITFMYGPSSQQQLQQPAAEILPDYVILDLSRVSPTYPLGNYTTFVADFVNNGNYGLVKLEDSYALFKKGSSYADGLCVLNGYFTTSAATVVKIAPMNILNEGNKRHLKGCEAFQEQELK
ncbi:DUF2079 domain-containing protein [Candidatus Woesearchaeota archaeon]|nr:DUF2079 domain-containing protein [Candidatus Woesearchaeota archaeon]